jgi:Cof subfamily protein (haloacid dehalogenase superfamily)
VNRLAVFDLDRTLLDDQSSISDETAARMRAVKTSGLACTVASGRDLERIAPFLRQLEWLAVPAITEQGAVVVEPGNGRILMERGISREALLSTMDTVRSARIPLNVILYGRDAPQVFRSAGAPRYVDGWGAGWYAAQLRDVPDAKAILTERVRKISVKCLPEHTDAIRQLLVDSLGPRANVVKADVDFVNIMDAGVNKGAALRWLITYLGVQAASVMAVGDCEADQSMFAVAGVPVAVANADEQTRSMAKYVVPSNNEQGAALALESFADGTFGR